MSFSNNTESQQIQRQFKEKSVNTKYIFVDFISNKYIKKMMRKFHCFYFGVELKMGRSFHETLYLIYSFLILNKYFSIIAS